MKTFRELQVSGQRDQIRAWIERVLVAKAEGWRRDVDAETKMAKFAHEPGKYWCFECEARNHPAASLWLHQDEHGSVSIANIVPVKDGSMSHDEYNAILIDFVESIARSAAEGLKVEVAATGDELLIEELLSGEAAAKLHQFSSLANKSTGSAHPMDRDRWNDFVIAAHRDHCDLDASTLVRWLIEEDGWPEDQAYELGIEYEQGRALLDRYDG